jgi:hypothetical protein
MLCGVLSTADINCGSREQYEATPRQTYFHMVTMLADVEPGGGAFTIIPGSHHATFAAAGRLWPHGPAALAAWEGELSQQSVSNTTSATSISAVCTSTAVPITHTGGCYHICRARSRR